MLPLIPRLVCSLLLLAPFAAVAGEEVVETFPDGSVRVRYESDAQGRRHGPYLEYAADGTLVVRATYQAGLLHGRELRYYRDGKRLTVATYKLGVLHGRFERYHPNGRRALSARYADGKLAGKQVESSADGTRVLEAEYADDELHGSLRIKDHGKTLTRQIWTRGELEEIDGLHPFARRRAELLAQLAAILAVPAEGVEPSTDPQAAPRCGACKPTAACADSRGASWRSSRPGTRAATLRRSSAGASAV